MFIFGGYDGRDGNYFNDLFYFNFGTNVCACGFSDFDGSLLTMNVL